MIFYYSLKGKSEIRKNYILLRVRFDKKYDFWGSRNGKIMGYNHQDIILLLLTIFSVFFGLAKIEVKH